MTERQSILHYLKLHSVIIVKATTGYGGCYCSIFDTGAPTEPAENRTAYPGNRGRTNE